MQPKANPQEGDRFTSDDLHPMIRSSGAWITDWKSIIPIWDDEVADYGTSKISWVFRHGAPYKALTSTIDAGVDPATDGGVKWQTIIPAVGFIQRGKDETGATGVRTVTLPQAFANTNYQVAATVDHGSTFDISDTLWTVTVGNKTTSSFQFRVMSLQLVPVVGPLLEGSDKAVDWVAAGE